MELITVLFVLFKNAGISVNKAVTLYPGLSWPGVFIMFKKSLYFG